MCSMAWLRHRKLAMVEAASTGPHVLTHHADQRHSQLVQAIRIDHSTAHCTPRREHMVACELTYLIGKLIAMSERQS